MNRIITVGREFGSGGREIGRRIAQELNIAYYDHEIVTELIRRTHLAEEYIRTIFYGIKTHYVYSYTQIWILRCGVAGNGNILGKKLLIRRFAKRF